MGVDVRTIERSFDPPQPIQHRVAVAVQRLGRAAGGTLAAEPDLERVEQEKRNECVGRYERYLRRLGILGDDLDAAIRHEAAEALRAGIAAAEAEPDADVSLLFDHAYANPPASFAHDLAELRRILGGDVG